jgi:hypothetical protein
MTKQKAEELAELILRNPVLTEVLLIDVLHKEHTSIIRERLSVEEQSKEA